MMFIHIGNNNVIQSKDIVSIVDISVISSSSIMEEMMCEGEKQMIVIEPKNKAKSVVITKKNIYYSSLSVPTLKKRSGFTSVIKKLKNYSSEI